MDFILLAAFPVPLRLLTGLGVLLVVVLTAFWFFMVKNNPRSQKVDEVPLDNKKYSLQNRQDKGEISETDLQEKTKGLGDEETKQR